jgi:hypothetical protein
MFTYSPSASHPYDFVVLTSSTHQRHFFLCCKQEYRKLEKPNTYRHSYIILYIRMCVGIYHIANGRDRFTSNAFRKNITFLKDAQTSKFFSFPVGTSKYFCTRYQSASINNVSAKLQSLLLTPYLKALFIDYFYLFAYASLWWNWIICNCLFSRIILKHSCLHLHHPQYKFYGIAYFIRSI